MFFSGALQPELPLTQRSPGSTGPVPLPASAHGGTKPSSKGRPRPRCRRRDCGPGARARETHPYPHAGLSKRRDHARRRSQLGDSSAGGQPRGGRSTASRTSPPRCRDTRRGQIQAAGSGTVAPGCLAGSAARGRHGTPATLAPYLPQLGHWLPGAPVSSPHRRAAGARPDALARSLARRNRQVASEKAHFR